MTSQSRVTWGQTRGVTKLSIT